VVFLYRICRNNYQHFIKHLLIIRNEYSYSPTGENGYRVFSVTEDNHNSRNSLQQTQEFKA